LENLIFEEKFEFREIGSKSYQQHVATDDEFLEKLLNRYSILKELLEGAVEKKTWNSKRIYKDRQNFYY